MSLQPGPNDGGEIDSGGRIGADDTSAPVDLDQLFNSLDPGARKGLQQVIQGSAAQYQGRAADAARSLKYFAPALNSTSRLTRELVVDDEVFSRFITDTSDGMGAIAERRDDLSGLVQNTGTALGAIGDENVALSRALELLPGTLRKSNTTFVNLRAALDDLDVLVEESKIGTRDLAPFLRRLRPLVTDARPTIRDLRTLIRTPGANNDLIELTGKLPRLQQLDLHGLPARQPHVRPLAGVRGHAAPVHARPCRLVHQVRPGGELLRRQRPLRPHPADRRACSTTTRTRASSAASPTPSGSTASGRASSAAARAAPCSRRPTARRPFPVDECDPNQTPPGG